MKGKVLGLLLVAGLALVSTLLFKPSQAEGLVGGCPESGIVPGSAFVASSTNLAGNVAGHVVWFQLCQPLRAASTGEAAVPRISRIALNWQYGVDEGFYLGDRETSGITLRVFDGAKSWDATTEYYTSSHCCAGAYFQDAAVDFTGDSLDADLPASMASPLTLQFVIPAASGMLNPLSWGKYSWEIVTVHEYGSYCSTFTEKFSSVILEVASGSIEPWEPSGAPGTLVELSGSGFQPFSPIQGVRAGWLEPKWDGEAYTDSEGRFDLEIVIPGLDIGMHPILVQVGGKSVATKFVVTSSAPGSSVLRVEDIVDFYGWNIDVIFHFNPYNCHWSFYDPDVPESDLTLMCRGEPYWILFREPPEEVTGAQTRNLTCTPKGNCWNVMVW